MPAPARLQPILLLLAASIAAVPASAAITGSAKVVELPDAFAGQQLLVSDARRDVTREATYASSDPKIATVDAKGYVAPVGNGSATIRIIFGSDKLEIPTETRRKHRNVWR